MGKAQVWIVILALAVGCAAVWLAVRDYRAARRGAEKVATVPLVEVEPPAAEESAPPSAPADAPEPITAAAATSPRGPSFPSDTSAAATPSRFKKRKKAKPLAASDVRRGDAAVLAPRPAAPDPEAVEAAAVAREALLYVGADPAAEAVWIDAINDPSRTPHERQDLIEDLNQEGFPDPKNPTPDDLPLIESRLALIEQYAPDAMDEVNAAAFAEAYKDLINMYAKAAGQ